MKFLLAFAVIGFILVFAVLIGLAILTQAERQAAQDVKKRGYIASELRRNRLLEVKVPAHFNQLQYESYKNNFEGGQAIVSSDFDDLLVSASHHSISTRFALGVYRDLNALHESAIITIVLHRPSDWSRHPAANKSSGPKDGQSDAEDRSNILELSDLLTDVKRRFRDVSQLDSKPLAATIIFESDKGLYSEGERATIMQQSMDSLRVDEDKRAKLFKQIDAANQLAKTQAEACINLLESRYRITLPKIGDLCLASKTDSAIIRVRQGSISIFVPLATIEKQNPETSAKSFSVSEKTWEDLVRVPEEARRPVLLSTYRNHSGDLAVMEIREISAPSFAASNWEAPLREMLASQTPPHRLVIWRQSDLPALQSMSRQTLENWLRDNERLQNAAHSGHPAWSERS